MGQSASVQVVDATTNSRDHRKALLTIFLNIKTLLIIVIRFILTQILNKNPYMRRYSLVATLPIDHQGIVRAAEEMISDYGPQALAKAAKRSQELRSEGFESIANTWDLICEVIKDQQDSERKPEAYKNALDRNVLLSE